MVAGMTDSVDRLYAAVLVAQDADPAHSRTARLMRAGPAKMAKKLGEEAFEVVIDALQGNRDAVGPSEASPPKRQRQKKAARAAGSDASAAP